MFKVFIIAVSLVALTFGEHKVTLVQVLFRHGDRTPLLVEGYPTDPYKEFTYEPWGHGQLTNIGKLREWQIGNLLRNRYNDFLGSSYEPKSILAVSSDTDRTKMSLQLVLAGLYPAPPGQIWHPEYSWQPIPTHYTPIQLDTLLQPMECPEYQKALENLIQDEEMQKKIAAHSKLYRHLSTKTGREITKSRPVYEIYHLVTAQKGLNLTLPEWLTDEIYEEMGAITSIEYERQTRSTELKRRSGGMLIRRFIENMNATTVPQSLRKIYLYSGHEINIAMFTRAHGIQEPKIPNYGSAVIVEKLQDEEDRIFVRFLLWTGVSRELVPLQIPGCDEICPFETYLELTNDVVPSDHETTCHWRHLPTEQLYRIFDDTLNRE